MAELDRLLRAKPETRLDIALRPEDLRKFQAQGFLRIDRIAPPDEVAWLAALYDWIFEERATGVAGGAFDLARPYESDGPDRLPQILLPEKRTPELLDTNFYRNGRRLAAQLLDTQDGSLDVGGHMIFKPAGGSELPWHQDEAYWDPDFDHEAVGVWMPLDDASVESGCLHFVPGSHRWGVLPHRHIGDDPSIHGLRVEAADTASSVAVPVVAGGATIHHCRTLHYSGPNASAQPRRAYTNEFQRPPVRRREPADRPGIDQTQIGWARREPK